jgi:hypothetical protein
MKIKYDVVDNFLPEKIFKPIEDWLMGQNFPWYCGGEGVSTLDVNDGIYHIHTFYDNMARQSDNFNLIQHTLHKLKVKSLIRCKANSYPSTHKIIEHGKHIDYKFKHKSFLLSINTCNGFTRLADGTKISSVRNRGLFFEGWREHNSSTCTDKNRRININFSYF